MPNGITTDQLNIKITVDSSGATQGIDEVKRALGELRSVAESRNLTGLKELATVFADFSASAKSLYSVAFSGISAGISNLVDSLARIDQVSFAENARKTGEALKELARPAELFTSHAAGLGKAADGLMKLGTALATWGDGVDVEQIKGMSDPLDELGKVVRNVAKTGNNLNQLKNGLTGLKKAIEDFSISNSDIDKLGPILERISENVDKFSESSQKGASAIYRIANALRNLNEVGFSAKLADNMRDAANALSLFVQQTVRSIPEDTIEKFIRLGDAVQHVVKIRSAQKAVDVWSNSLSKAGHSTSLFAKILKGLGSVMLSALVAPFKFGASAVSGLIDSFKKLEAVVSRAISSVKKLAATMLKGAFNLAISPIKGGINAVQRFGEAFKKLGSTIKRLVLYRFLRSMIRAVTQQVKLGIDALYNWSDVVGYRFKGAMDGLATSFQYLRNSVAAMLSPLVEYLQPVIDVLIDKFVQFLNVVNQFIATLTGKSTYVRAIKGAAKYAEETGYAAAAQEKLNRTILGFDELNKLNDTNDRGHGSPTANAGGGEFEEVPITESFDKINWKDLGKKLSDGLTTALNSIKWSTIQKKVNGVVQKIAGFFDDFFGNRDLWLAIGNTVGEGINTITGAILSFTDNVGWENIGSNIADGVRKAIGTINWEDLGRAAVAVLGALKKIFKGFTDAMTPEDWQSLKDGISTAVNSALSELGINWSTIKTKMKNIVKKFADNFSSYFGDDNIWSNVGAIIGKGINFVTTTILTLTGKADWADIGEDIRDSFMSAVQTINWEDLGKTAVSGLSAIVKLFHGFISSMSQADWAQIGHDIGTALTAAINEINWDEFLFDMINFALGLTTAVINALEAVDFSGVLRNFFDGSKRDISDFFYYFEENMVRLLEFLRPIFGSILPGWGETIDKAIELAKQDLDSGAGHTRAKTQEMVDDAKKVVDQLVANNVITKQQAEEFNKILNSGSGSAKESVVDLVNSLNRQGITMNKDAKRNAKTSMSEVLRELDESIPGIKTSAVNIRSAVTAEFELLEGGAWTSGDDFGWLFSRGLAHAAQAYIAPAAYNAAQSARQYLAFSKPDKGPLSDADKYGPDFMKLYAQGIENSKSLVTNAVSGLASDVNNAMALENTYTLHNEPTGLDSLAQAIANSDTPINVYIGSDKLDSVIARANSRLNYRSGGRF